MRWRQIEDAAMCCYGEADMVSFPGGRPTIRGRKFAGPQPMSLISQVRVLSKGGRCVNRWTPYSAS
jgi:hypothetical protein